jgi:predicted GNAT family N-acyltransferase
MRDTSPSVARLIANVAGVHHPRIGRVLLCAEHRGCVDLSRLAVLGALRELGYQSPADELEQMDAHVAGVVIVFANGNVVVAQFAPMSAGDA